MGDILLFPERSCVEISTGLIRETRRHGASGVSSIRHDPPVRVYWLDIVEADGGRLCVWDGTSYAAALVEARSLRSSDGLAIRDLTRKTWGHG